MPVVPFIPMIASGIGSLISSKSNKTPQSATSEAMGQSIAGAQGAAGNVSGLSKYLQQQAQYTTPALGRAMNYYDTLLRGNRAAMGAAVAPQAGAITDASKGAQMNLERLGVTGGQKVQAMADLARQTGGQLGHLTMGVQPGAAKELAGIGAQGVGMTRDAMQGFGSAGNIYSNLVKGQADVNKMTYDRQQQQGSVFGKLIGQGLNVAAGMFGGGDQGGLPIPGEEFDPSKVYG